MGLSTTHHQPAPAVTTVQTIPHATLDCIRQFDTCTIGNAIEHFRVRLRNEGFTRPGLRCVTGGSPAPARLWGHLPGYRPLPVTGILAGETAGSGPDQAMRNIMRNIVSKPHAMLVLVAAACLSASCSKREPVEASNPKASDIPTVAVAKVTTEDLSHSLVLTAEFRPYQEVDVMAKVAGFVKQINVDVGDRVKDGQPLATLEIPEMDDDLRRADAAVVRARAEVTRAQDEQHRAESAYDIAHLSYQRLFAVSEKKPGLVAQQEIDEARSRELVAGAQVAASKSALSAAQEQVNVNLSDMQRVKTMMEYTRVAAPVAVLIDRRYPDQGSQLP